MSSKFPQANSSRLELFKSLKTQGTSSSNRLTGVNPSNSIVLVTAASALAASGCSGWTVAAITGVAGVLVGTAIEYLRRRHNLNQQIEELHKEAKGANERLKGLSDYLERETESLRQWSEERSRKWEEEDRRREAEAVSHLEEIRERERLREDERAERELDKKVDKLELDIRFNPPKRFPN